MYTGPNNRQQEKAEKKEEVGKRKSSVEEIVEAEGNSGESCATLSSVSSCSGDSASSSTNSGGGKSIRVGGHRVKRNHFYADFHLAGFTSKETTVRLFFSRSIVVNCAHKEEEEVERSGEGGGGSEFRTYMKKVLLPPGERLALSQISAKIYPCGLLRVQVPYLPPLKGTQEKDAEGADENGPSRLQVQMLTEVANIRKKAGRCRAHPASTPADHHLIKDPRLATLLHV